MLSLFICNKIEDLNLGNRKDKNVMPSLGKRKFWDPNCNWNYPASSCGNALCSTHRIINHYSSLIIFLLLLFFYFVSYVKGRLDSWLECICYCCRNNSARLFPLTSQQLLKCFMIILLQVLVLLFWLTTINFIIKHLFKVSSFTVNILRTFFLGNDSGHWSEMILSLQVSPR